MTEEALRHFKASLTQGRPWFPSLLEAIGLWTQAEEEVNGQRHRYLIGGEAFDWLRLAQRLCAEVDGLLPAQEVEQLLFHGQAPQEVSPEEFQRLIGPAKYKAYLNYFYGVVVEEALQGAVEEEVKKERTGLVLATEESWLSNEVCLRLYGAPEGQLLDRFRQERGYPCRPEMSLEEAKEFTYWLFRYRVHHSEPDRLASDTKKGLAFLQRLKQGRSPL